jgi:hypothetical protein
VADEWYWSITPYWLAEGSSNECATQPLQHDDSRAVIEGHPGAIAEAFQYRSVERETSDIGPATYLATTGGGGGDIPLWPIGSCWLRSGSG